jgi:hypothetical protein
MADTKHQELDTSRARAGDTPHVARYVLLFSTLATVIAFAIMLALWT